MDAELCGLTAIIERLNIARVHVQRGRDDVEWQSCVNPKRDAMNPPCIRVIHSDLDLTTWY